MNPNLGTLRSMARILSVTFTCLMFAGCGLSTRITDKVMARHSSSSTAQQVNVAKGTPMIDVAIPLRGVAGPMAQIAVKGDVSEWRSADGIGLTLRRGQIIATRGFGPDLLIADSQADERAVLNGGGQFRRTMHWLDGENHDRAVVLACTLVTSKRQTKPDERALSETCIGPLTSFTNTYVVSVTNGRLIRSDQWISPGLGHIQIEPR